METPIKYNITFQQYTQNQNSVISNCAEITFINNGTSNLLLNNTLELKPTQSLTITAEQYEMDTTIYQVTFDAFTGNKCTIIKKNYMEYAKDTFGTKIIRY